jgi:hypothetical protein
LRCKQAKRRSELLLSSTTMNTVNPKNAARAPGQTPIVYLQPIAEASNLSQALARMRQIAEVSGT